ncbi:hypothetical protein GGF50DRAFT_115252 [Schizophyllum commune]
MDNGHEANNGLFPQRPSGVYLYFHALERPHCILRAVQHEVLAMDAFFTLEDIIDTAPLSASDADFSTTPEPIRGELDDMMRFVADADSPDGYFGGYCVVA